ncbi:MAG: hypothetical protein H7281_08910, partial [Bacteriovorax sp.]|nr:hypothetical protein [Bacteriovorax sp.]
MKTLNTALVTLLISSIFPISATVQAASPFCQNPLQFTCPDNGEAGKIREEKIDRIELELKTVAFSNTLLAIKDDELKKQLNTFEDIDNITPKRKRKGVEKIFYANLRVAFGVYIKKGNLPENLGFDMIREALHLAIENSPEIPVEFK